MTQQPELSVAPPEEKQYFSSRKFPEYSTEENAKILARNIQHYWIAEGFPGIEVVVRREVDHPNAPYRIFSNIANTCFASRGRNGFPPGGRGEPIEKLRIKAKEWRV